MDLLDSTEQLINQPNLSSDDQLNDLTYYIDVSSGGGKKIKKKLKKDSKTKKDLKPKKDSKPKKVKLIDTFLKIDLEKIAKKYDVNLKKRDGKLKTKEELFNSLKKKKLI